MNSEEQQMSQDGQPWRLPGASREAILHAQLYRYAEDLQQLLEAHDALQTDFRRLQESYVNLDQAKDLFGRLIASSRDIHVITAGDGTVLQINPAAEVIAPPSEILGSRLEQWLEPESRESYRRLISLAFIPDGKVSGDWEFRLQPKAAGAVPIIVSAQILQLHKPDGLQLHWVLRNVTVLREKEFETQISEMVFRNTAEGVMITDVEGVILAVNPAFTRITGYAENEIVGKRPNVLKSGVQDAAFYQGFWTALREEGCWEGEVQNRKKDGEVYVEWLSVSAARDRDGRILSYIAVFSDLSRLLQAEKRLFHLAHHDSLTGLPNRLLLQERLVQTIAQSRRSGIPLVLIFVDLDRFKVVNDTLGHEAGDLVLREAAWRLSSTVREIDTVARFGGDEFVILAPGLSGVENIGTVCNKIIGALSSPLVIDGVEMFIGGSLGCAEYPIHGDDELTLLKHADAAMYQAKNSGGNTHVLFDPRASSDGDSLRLETELRHALERNELRLEYQPQVSATSGELVGVEALLRWDHPRLGTVSPAQFVPLAEQIGLIVPIGSWVLKTACQQLALWRDSGLGEFTMSVNVSPRQLRDADFVDVVKSAVRDAALPPQWLELEVTEGEVMHHFEHDICQLAPLRQLGVRIAIDDFGTGYSSLARLQQLPIDRLKIDRSFIIGLQHEGDSRPVAVSAAIVTMGRALGLNLVAEGVENDEQLDILAAQGCDVIQGYLTGRPMRPEALVKWHESLAAAPARGVA